MDDLTKRQKEVLHFIARKILRDFLPPTIREIASQFAFSSTGTVRNYLKTLVTKGYLRVSRHTSRGIELDKAKLFRIPLLGKVIAGSPDVAYEHLEDYVDLGRLLEARDDLFALQIRGDSMIDSGIMPQDVVLVKKQSVCRNGDIVVALVNNEATVKRLRLAQGAVLLEPANRRYKPIRADNIKIIGKVISVIRSYV